MSDGEKQTKQYSARNTVVFGLEDSSIRALIQQYSGLTTAVFGPNTRVYKAEDYHTAILRKDLTTNDSQTVNRCAYRNSATMAKYSTGSAVRFSI